MCVSRYCNIACEHKWIITDAIASVLFTLNARLISLSTHTERASRPLTAGAKAAALRTSVNAALLAASIRTTQQVRIIVSASFAVELTCNCDLLFKVTLSSSQDAVTFLLCDLLIVGSSDCGGSAAGVLGCHEEPHPEPHQAARALHSQVSQRCVY